VPLSRKLRSGDTVEILTSPRARPKREWLMMVRTSGARSKIRQFLKEEEAQKALPAGREALEKEARKLGTPVPADRLLETTAKELRFRSARNLLAAVGRGEVSPYGVLKHLYPEMLPSEQHRRPAIQEVREKAKREAPVSVGGIDHVMVRYSQCCQPIPGDLVRGYITKGQGISIHRAECPNINRNAIDQQRVVDVDWGKEKGVTYMARLIVTATDRKGLVADIAGVIAETSTNIGSALVKTKGFQSISMFTVDVEDREKLRSIMDRIRKVKGVMSVDRSGFSTRT
jgi:GTP pyrophosphokinase